MLEWRALTAHYIYMYNHDCNSIDSVLLTSCFASLPLRILVGCLDSALAAFLRSEWGGGGGGGGAGEGERERERDSGMHEINY